MARRRHEHVHAGADGHLHLQSPGWAIPRYGGRSATPATMAGKDKLFGIDGFAGDSSFGQAFEVEIQAGVPLSLHFQVGDDPNSGGISELRFRLHLWDLAEGEKLSVELNGAALQLAPGEEQHAGSTGCWLECRLRPEQVRRGENPGRADDGTPGTRPLRRRSCWIVSSFSMRY